MKLKKRKRREKESRRRNRKWILEKKQGKVKGEMV